jgi:hypothetical protein
MRGSDVLLFLSAVVVTTAATTVSAFGVHGPQRVIVATQKKTTWLNMAAETAENNPSSVTLTGTASIDWELDCYSRPVLVEGGKKLWEVLITDSTGNMRICKSLPSSRYDLKQIHEPGFVDEAFKMERVVP